MKIKRCKDQTRATLEEFYEEMLSYNIQGQAEYIFNNQIYTACPLFSCSPSIDEINLSESISIDNDPDYRNYFGLPSDKWLISGENISLVKGEYKITTEISW